MMKLIQPCKEYEEEIYAFRDEYIADLKSQGAEGAISLQGCGGLERSENLEDWLAHLGSYADRNRIDPASGMVEGSQWMLVDEEKHRILGMINLRHYLNEYLSNFGGHIGYSVRPSERRKGYGKLQLNMALDILREKGVERALLTCDSENAGSYKTMEACGAVLENEVYNEEHKENIRRYWIAL